MMEGPDILSVQETEAQKWDGTYLRSPRTLTWPSASAPLGLRQSVTCALFPRTPPPQPPGLLSDSSSRPWAGTQATSPNARDAGHCFHLPSLFQARYYCPEPWTSHIRGSSRASPACCSSSSLLPASLPSWPLPASSEIRGHYHQGVRSEHSHQHPNFQPACGPQSPPHNQ